MATIEEAQQALLDAIAAEAKRAGSNSADHVRGYAEAWAWLKRPDQAHGGDTTVRS